MSMNLTKTSFFKSLVAFAAAGVMATTGFAQSQNYSELPVKTLSASGHASQASVEASQAEQMPMTEATINDDKTGTVSLDAQWDLQFAYSASDTSGYFSQAGAYWTGTEFWTSKWNSDTLSRLSATGQLIEIFTIAGVSGTRSITGDGTNIYLGLATDQIAIVDPTTKTLTGAISITGNAAGIGSRVCTYDPTLDGGNGGFFIANFTSDIGVVSMTGTTLAVIDQATHGRIGMYGGAYDGISTGGPYLWVFEQSGNPTDAIISQLALPSGTWTGVSFDVDTDLGIPGSLAGGLFIASGIVTGQNTIGGMAQGDPNALFGYELDFVPIQIDAQLSVSNMVPGLSIVPKNQIPAYSFAGEVSNFGQSGITSGTVDVEIEDLEDNSIVFTQSASLGLVPSLGTVPYNVGPYSPVDTGAYFVTVTAGTGAQTDENLTNNEDFFGIFVSDSTLARDQGPAISNFGVGAGANQNAVLAHSLTIQQTDYLTSVTMVFGAPPVGQQVFATIYAANPAGGPQANPIASTEVYTFTQDDADNGVVITLAMAGQPQPLPPGDFYIGVNELAENVGLVVTGGIVTDGALWFRADNIGGGVWNQATNAVVLAVRGNFGPCHSALTATVVVDDDDAGNGDASLSIQAGGGSGSGYTYQWDDPALSTGTEITNVAGGRIYNVTVTDSEGCTKTFSSDLVNIWATSVEEELGITAFKAYPNPARNEVFAEIEMDRAQTVTVAMYDQRGRIVFSKEIKNALNVVESVNVSDYPAGIYSLQLTTNEGSVSRKISVE